MPPADSRVKEFAVSVPAPPMNWPVVVLRTRSSIVIADIAADHDRRRTQTHRLARSIGRERHPAGIQSIDFRHVILPADPARASSDSACPSSG